MEKARDKQEKRLRAKERKSDLEPRSDLAEDPDIAGMRPGPQAVPDEWAPFMPEEEEEENSEETEEEQAKS